MLAVKLLLYWILQIRTIHSVLSQYEHYSLYRVTAFNSDERAILYEIHVNNEKVNFLNGVTNDAALPMNVVVDVCCTLEFEMALQDQYIEYSNIDAGQLQNEFNQDRFDDQRTDKLPPNILQGFLAWDRLLIWTDDACKRYASLKKITVGNTYENREMLVLKLSTGERKPAVFIMGGEQGRDMISTAIVLNFLNYLLENPQEIMLKRFDFYFLPVFNPDGYEYSYKQRDPFWSKNRKAFFPSKLCPANYMAVGVDIDRNWFSGRPAPIPNGECLSVYTGNKCLSEEETKSVSNFLNSIAVNLLGFINIRGFENLVTVPFADPNISSNNQALLIEMLLFACSRVQEVYNVSYKFSTTESCLFNFSGNAADWVKLQLNVPVVYTIYMQHEHYVLPHKDHIIPLTDQFTLIAQEMLVLGSSIYGPLFSNQTSLCNNDTAIFIRLFSMMIFLSYLLPLNNFM